MSHYVDREKRLYRKLSQEANRRWLLRQGKLADAERQSEVAEAALSARESLPSARAPEFEDDEDVPLTTQGRALRASRRSRVTP